MTLLAEVATGWVSHFATVLGLDRTSWYRQSTQQADRDAEAGGLLLTAHSDHPRYGYRRLGWFLGWSAHKTRRIMQLVELVIGRRKKGWRQGGKAEITAPANALRPYAVFKDETHPQDGMDYSAMVASGAWVQDFTHLWFLGAWCYLAVVLDLATRQVVGWQLGLRHTSELTFQAVLSALTAHAAPPILHSDQGSEYLRALLLPEIAAISQPATLIAPRLPFQEGHKVQINRNGEEERAVLNQRRAATGNYNQFEYRSLGQVAPERETPVTGWKTHTAGGDEDFDSLWKSL